MEFKIIFKIIKTKVIMPQIFIITIAYSESFTQTPFETETFRVDYENENLEIRKKEKKGKYKEAKRAVLPRHLETSKLTLLEILRNFEISNNYLNNFTSIFVANLKDMIPKDPEPLNASNVITPKITWVSREILRRYGNESLEQGDDIAKVDTTQLTNNFFKTPTKPKVEEKMKNKLAVNLKINDHAHSSVEDDSVENMVRSRYATKFGCNDSSNISRNGSKPLLMESRKFYISKRVGSWFQIVQHKLSAWKCSLDLTGKRN